MLYVSVRSLLRQGLERRRGEGVLPGKKKRTFWGMGKLKIFFLEDK